MHTYVGSTCSIIYNSDLSGETIISQGGNVVSINLKDISDFLIHQAVVHGEARPFEDTIGTSNVSSITIESTTKSGNITTTRCCRLD